MKIQNSILDKIDSVIRFFLYVIVFWIPYSPAAIEICVTISSLLWLIKRSIILFLLRKENKEGYIIGDIKKAYRPKKTFLDKYIGLFLFFCLLSVSGSMFFLHSLHGFFTKTLEWFVIFYLVQEVFYDKKHFKTAIIVLAVTSIATVLDSFYQFYISSKDIFNGNELILGRATAGFHHPNSLAPYLLVCISFIGAFVANRRLRVHSRIIFSLLFILFCWSLAITFSRAGLVSLVISCLFFVSFYKKKTAIISMIILLGLTVIFSMNISKHIKNNSRFSEGSIASASSWRIGVWEDTYKMIEKKPLVGYGINTYMQVFQKYRRKYLNRYEYSPTYAHNCYIQMTAEIGLLGLISFMLIIFNLFLNVIKYERNNILLMGILSGLLGFLMHSFFDTDFYSLQLSTLLWMTIGFIAAVFSYKQREAQ